MAEKQKFSLVLQTPAINKLITNTLGDKEVAMKFVAEISTLVGNNSTLQNCDANSIISAGLLAQTLKLSLAPTLGHCYIVPFKGRGQFILGYKGLIQLAQRSREYEKMDVRNVHKGEHLGQDEDGEDIFKFDHKYDNEEVIGYYAYFKLKNGYKHSLYWTKEEANKHGLRFSQSYRNNAAGTNVWRDDFDKMAQKSVLKTLLSRWGILSIDMQRAFINDQAIVNANLEPESYPDNQPEPTDKNTTNIVVPDIPTDEETGEIKEDKEVRPEDFMN